MAVLVAAVEVLVAVQVVVVVVVVVVALLVAVVAAGGTKPKFRTGANRKQKRPNPFSTVSKKNQTEFQP